MHSKPGFADRVSGRKLFRIFSISLIQRNDTFTVINVFDQVVNRLDVVTFIGNKNTFSNAVNQHMILAASIVFKFSFIKLIRSSMYTGLAFFIRFWIIALGKLIFRK